MAARSFLLAMVLLSGCEAEVSAPVPAVPAAGAPMPVAPTEPPVTVVPAPTRSSVELPPERLQLLPFEVRLKRLAAAVELPVADPAFDALRSRATDLGAHDFANGVAPDLAWTGRRLSVWIEGLAPICSDSRVRTRLADWAASMPQFALRAWGRPSTPEDVAELVTGGGLSAADAWRANCVVLLSGVELLSP
ncbi:MAG: hypothetical protein SFW67_31410 [Myxococcaceae bacterium]|nr:hypothetical protein [Myxococcaceae bacterium]